jgi:hypothetical protein
MAPWSVMPQSLLDDSALAEWLGEGRDPKLVIEAARHSAARLAQ